MDLNSKPEKYQQEHLALDESYWSALFDQEEALSPPEKEASPPIDQWPGTPVEAASSQNPEPEPYDPRHSWQLAQEIYQADQTVELEVEDYNKGGLLVNWHGLQGFVPASQLADFPHFHLVSKRQEELRRRQNQRLTLKIIEVVPQENRLIFSERAAQTPTQAKRALLQKLETGDIRSGTVTNLANFGAFVDLGGVEGLIHISELSWRRVEHPSDILQPGQEVEVLILEVHPTEEQIALSRKQLRPDPWQTVEEKYEAGQIVKGVVTNVTNFGAFVLVEEGLEGLVHISELAEGTFLHPHNVVDKGDQVTACVLLVDCQKRRLALSMRRVANPILSTDGD